MPDKNILEIGKGHVMVVVDVVGDHEVEAVLLARRLVFVDAEV